MMQDDELEIRIRDAMTTDQTLPRDGLFDAVITRRSLGERVLLPTGAPNRRWRWGLIGTAAAAGLLIVVPLTQRNESPRPTESTARRSTKASEDNFFLPAALLAQSSTSPAYPTLTGAVSHDLRPGRWTLGQVVDGQVREQYRYSLERSRHENEPSWLLISEYFYGSQVRKVDSMWTSPDSLTPRVQVSHAGAIRIERTYRADDILTGTTQNGFTSWTVASTRIPSWEVVHGLLQVSSVALRFQATQLSRDWKRSLPYPALTPGDSVVYLNLVVDGEEEIEVPAGKFAAWRIRLQVGDRPLKPYDPAQPPPGIYYWVSKDRQWMLRMTFQGSGGPDTTPIVLLKAEED